METNPAALADAILKKIDLVGLKRVEGVYPNSTWTKFFNAGEYAYAGAMHAARLDADLPRGARCLDIGCGFGYVALGLEILGHTCIAWDTPSPILRNVAHMIPVSGRVFRTIEPGVSLRSELYGYFDLIFLHGVFPMRGPKGWWEWADYANLAVELVDTLNPGGRLEILVNRGDELEKICNSAAWMMLAKNAGDDFDATVEDNCIRVRRSGAVVTV
jgi:SAM-dependent methyltransferase